MIVVFWIIFGALAGWIASLIVETNKTQGTLANIAVGIVGAMIGGLMLDLLHIDGGGFGQFSMMSLLVAVTGSVVFLMLLRLLRGNTHA